MPSTDLVSPGYLNGFAPRDGFPLNPNLWQGCVVALDPGLGISGTTLYDWSGRRNDGALTNPATTAWTVDEHGGCLDMSAATDYLLIPYSERMQTDKYSFSIWIKSTETGGNAGIVSRWQSVGGSYSWCVIQANATLYWYYRGVSVLTMSNLAHNDGKWHHLCGTYDQTTVRFYMDGIQKNSVPQTIGAINTVEPIVIGNYALTVSPINQDWDGKWRSFAFWNRALSANEVRQLSADPAAMYRLEPRRFSISSATTNRRRRLLLGASQ